MYPSFSQPLSSSLAPLTQSSGYGASQFEHAVFPTQQLGPKLEALIFEIHNETGASISAIASALIAVITLVCQGRIRIKKRHQLVSPVSLWFIGILPPGELKTSIVKRLLKGVEKFVEEQSEVHAVQMQEFDAAICAWRAEGKGILSAIKKKSAAFEPIEAEQARLQAHALRKPQKPKRFKLIHEKMSTEALHKNLSECFPTTSLISDDADRVFRSRGMSDMATLCKAYDGSDLISDRSIEGELIARDPCLTLLLLSQPEPFAAFLNGKGAMADGIGFTGRSFIIAPAPTAGYRSVVYSKSASDEVLNEFYGRCIAILKSHIGDDPTEMRPKIELSFSNEAQARWEAAFDNIQVDMRPGGLLENDKDFGAKLADKIARVAALLHFFEGAEDTIPLSTLERAISICQWYTHEFVRFFAKPVELPEEQQDANRLLYWFANHLRTGGKFEIKKNDVRQYGPNPLRNIMRLNTALRLLWSMGYACEGKIDGEKGAFIFLNQQYFTPGQVQLLCSQPKY